MRRAPVTPLLVAAVLALGACGGAGDGLQRVESPVTDDAEARVQVVDLAFSPDTTEVGVGDTVAWIWDRTRTEHDVAFRDARASPIQRSGTWQRSFDKSGTYDYVCTLHRNMTGRVIVR